MLSREDTIKGLECCQKFVNCDANGGCPYKAIRDKCLETAIRDAIALLKSSFTPKEVYDIVIEHGQHDKRFKLGDTIDYTFTEVVDILNTELMCKAGDV